MKEKMKIELNLNWTQKQFFKKTKEQYNLDEDEIILKLINNEILRQEEFKKRAKIIVKIKKKIFKKNKEEKL